MTDDAGRSLAFALAGLGGFNAHGAGVLQAAGDAGVVPDLVTATSGQIVVLADWLLGKDLEAALVDPRLEHDPVAQIGIALSGDPGVFRPAYQEAWRRWWTLPVAGENPMRAILDRVLPAQVYVPTRAAADFQTIADALNGAQRDGRDIGVVFNAYDFSLGTAVLFGNDAARQRWPMQKAIPAATRSVGSRDKPAAEPGLQPITPKAVESALWLSLYGFQGLPQPHLIDGAYHRSCLVAELHDFDRIVVARPLAEGWLGKGPRNYFEVQDWQTEMWFSVAYKAEVDALHQINGLVADGRLGPPFKTVEIKEIAPKTPAGFSNYFIERERIFRDAHDIAARVFVNEDYRNTPREDYRDIKFNSATHNAGSVAEPAGNTASHNPEFLPKGEVGDLFISPEAPPANYGLGSKPDFSSNRVKITAIGQNKSFSESESQLVNIKGHNKSDLNINNSEGSSNERIIDAHFFNNFFGIGEIASLLVTIRLPSSKTLGQFINKIELNSSENPINVILSCSGFTILSEKPAPLMLVGGRDSPPTAFELRIDSTEGCWLHIMIIQGGQSVGELVINDFSSASTKQKKSVSMVQIHEADLTIIVNSSEEKVILSSPRHIACMDNHNIMHGIKKLSEPFQQILHNQLVKLYNPSFDAIEVERELKLVGAQLADCLSEELRKFIRRSDIRTIMLRHDKDFDFPLELCFLDEPEEPFFLGDRIAICRWYLGVTNPPDVVFKRVRRVAFLKGADAAADPDEAMLQLAYPRRTTTLATYAAVRNDVFKKSDFDLIQFTGHCKVNAEGAGGLHMADGSVIRMIDIGQLKEERIFGLKQPLVLLNACSSAQPNVGLLDLDSFVFRFIKYNACAVVGTLWPVSGVIANEFASYFHRELIGNSVGMALLLAKKAITSNAGSGKNAEEININLIARQVAARSYCLFANPDLHLESAGDSDE